jgi:adenylate kinase family enzyme
MAANEVTGFSAKRIHITGAPGAGASTLSEALAKALGGIHCDLDDFLWKPSDPPLQRRYPVRERIRLIRGFIKRGSEPWVMSGSLITWGEPLTPLIDFVVFLYIDTDVRIARLKARELRRFGAMALAPGGVLYNRHKTFIEWAAHYDSGTRDGRSLPKHEEWLARIRCPVVRFHGEHAVDDMLGLILSTRGQHGGTFFAAPPFDGPQLIREECSRAEYRRL